MNGKLVNPITTGNFTVTDLNFVDEKNNIVYFTARKENSARKDLYRVNLNGKKLQRLTFGDFNHYSINLSPGARYFVTSYGNVSTPNRLALVSNTGKLIKELADSRGPEFEAYRLAETQLIRVKSEDGKYELPMKVTWPVNMDKSKNTRY